jgi:putative ABC transport system ATP-binding protein
VDSAVLVVAGLTKVYGSGTSRVEALRGIDLTIRRGEFVAVMGPSGSGKSSLLHLLAGLDQPTAGSVRVGGVDLAPLNEDERALMRRHQIGLMFQSFQLLDTLTAEENVALPLAISGCSAEEARRRAARMLGSVELAHRRQHRPHELSGGEQQRVAIARALVIEPLLLLADEPTGNLDSVQGRHIMALLRQLVEDQRQTLCMVTHDAGHAALADRIVSLRDGRIVEDRPAQAPPPLMEPLPPVEPEVPLPPSMDLRCVEWSAPPAACPFTSIAFVAPCARDALAHPASEKMP